MFDLAAIIKKHEPNRSKEAVATYIRKTTQYIADMKNIVEYVDNLLHADIPVHERPQVTEFTPDKWTLVIGKIVGMDRKKLTEAPSVDTMEVWIYLSRLSYTPPGNLFPVKNSTTKATLHSKIWYAAKTAIGSGAYHKKLLTNHKQTKLSWTTESLKATTTSKPQKVPPAPSKAKLPPTLQTTSDNDMDEVEIIDPPKQPKPREPIVSPDKPEEITKSKAKQWNLIKTKPPASETKAKRANTHRIVLKVAVAKTTEEKSPAETLFHSIKEIFEYWQELDPKMAILPWKEKDEQDKPAITNECKIDVKKESTMVKYFDCGRIQTGNVWINLHFACDNNPETFLSGKNSDCESYYNMKDVRAYAKAVQNSNTIRRQIHRSYTSN
jgi:hypothetical protein